MGEDGHRYRLQEAMCTWHAPCGCAVLHGLLNYAYRFCPAHAEATNHAPAPTSEHIRSLWRTHKTALALFFDAEPQDAA